jgi:hypothetical protein
MRSRQTYGDVLIGTESVNLGIRSSHLAYGTGFSRRIMGGPLVKKKKLRNH